jgi:hypothetical protein
LRFGIFIIVQMVISLCSVVLFIRLLYDQYDNFKDMMTRKIIYFLISQFLKILEYDFRKNKMIERVKIKIYKK